jgi:molecular chaperone GrpE (heat shock protein)
MKNHYILVSLLLCSSLVHADFIHPLEFDGSDEQKEQVIEYIKQRVKNDYCEKVDMCQDVMLRMMEKENLEAFKRLTQATEREILDRAIKDYCGTVDMCSYQMIDMMYKENLKASKKELTW